MAQLRLRFGNYRHAASEAAVQIQRTIERTDAGMIYGIRENWAITGRLQADTQAALTTAILALEDAYSTQVDSVALEYADESGRTAHAIDPGDLLTPIEVAQPPSYPIGDGAQYAGFRDYQIVITALVKSGQANSDLLQWEETVEVSGGYPIDVLVQTLNTLPIRQRAAQSSPCLVRQFGSATSSGGWPIPPTYLFNVFTEAVLLENRVQKHGDRATFINGSRKGRLYRSTWSYAFALPILVNPPGPRRPLSLPVSTY